MMVYTKAPRARTFTACKSPLDAAHLAKRLGARFISLRIAHGRYIVNHYCHNA